MFPGSSPPLTFVGPRTLTDYMPKYLKVMNPTNKLSNKICSAILLDKYTCTTDWKAQCEFRILTLLGVPDQKEWPMGSSLWPTVHPVTFLSLLSLKLGGPFHTCMWTAQPTHLSSRHPLQTAPQGSSLGPWKLV